MNRIEKMVSLVLIIFLPFSCKKEKESIPSECTILLAEDAYTYPILPDEHEWWELQSERERDSVLSIPNSILATISTDGLVETCLNYPLYIENVLNAITVQPAFNELTKRFNGYQELFRRELVGENLLQRYKQMKATCIVNNYPSGLSWIELSFVNIEILLAQDTILRQLDKSQLLELNNEALITYEDKLTLPEHSMLGRRMTALIIGRILKKEEYPPFIVKLNNDWEMNRFINEISFTGSEMLDTIVNYGNSFSNNNR